MSSASEMARQDEEVGIGHNSVDKGELRMLIERVERLEEEKKALGDDVKDVYSEAKVRGYDVKIMRKVVAWRKMEADARREMRSLEDTYLAVLGLD